MVRKLFTLYALSVAFGWLAAQKPNLIPIQGLKGAGYPAHAELNWENPNNFLLEIYRYDSQKRLFRKIAETNWDSYFDFMSKPVEKKQDLVYRVVPKGLPPESKEAARFEITIGMIPATQEALLDMTQRYTTRYFFDFAEPITGMARERCNNTDGDIVTTGGTGFGVMALVAGVERKYFTRAEAFEAIGKIVGFLEKAERFHGAWAHWYDAGTGEVFSPGRYGDGGDLVATAFLMEGLLAASAYFNKNNADEKLLVDRISRLWETVEWSWYTRGTDLLYSYWSKNHGWKMSRSLNGFDEALIAYVLAASSPTYPIERSVYENGYKKSSYYLNGKNYYGVKLDLGMEYGGPLSFAHYSFLGLNPNGLTDGSTNYFEQNRKHALVQVAYATENPNKHEGLGPSCWGFTLSDDPVDGYSPHRPGTKEENGTISPTAAISSIVYTPTESLNALRNFYFVKGRKLFGKFGFYDAFNMDMVEGQQVVHSYRAIGQGPIAVMIENYRSGLLWSLFMKNADVKRGLTKLGFSY
ncbi:MAG TPA: glucoamylase family protein [Paludibacter sp.]|nr:glucoamylase family protein [Paludibacter sp.]